MKNVYLVGFMGTGKTVVGKALAKRLNLEFQDLDTLIEAKAGKKISQIFEDFGEAHFRKLEKEGVAVISAKSGLVVACGGGVVMDADNLKHMKKSGVIICLKAAPEKILSRTKNYKHRPLLNVADPKAKIEELLKARQPFYAQADHFIDTTQLSVNEVVEEILKIVKQ